MLQAVINLMPSKHSKNIRGIFRQLTHGDQIQLIAILLYIVQLDNQRLLKGY